MPDMNKSRRHAMSRRVRVAAGLIAVTLIAMELAARTTRAEDARAFPGEVSSLVLPNPSMFRSGSEAKARIREMSPMAAMFSVQRFWARASCVLVWAFRPLLFEIGPRLEPEVPPHAARDAVLHRWESSYRTLRKVILQSRLEETLRLVGPLPITMIHGTDDRVTDRDRLEKIAAATGAELVVVRGTTTST